MNELKGIICIDKPSGFTSFDVVAKLRGILKTRKLGHSGTLDPAATGVLPVFAGGATKAISLLPDSDKTYIAGFRLGITTDTQDITGSITAEHPVPHLTVEELEAALADFRGDILQLPPMYSAVQVNGRRLYDLARQGIEVEREKRPVTIRRLELISFDGKEGTLSVECSKGTYIRTLINDIGDILGSGGVMTSLRRTTACGFTLDDCFTFEQLETMNGSFDAAFRPVESVFSHLPALYLSEEKTKAYKNGVKLDMSRLDADRSLHDFRVYGGGEFLGVAHADYEKNELRVTRNF